MSIFFNRLLKLNLVSESQTFTRFITESKFQKEKMESSDPQKEVP